MNGILTLTLLAVLAISGASARFTSYVAGGTPATNTELHACMLLVFRADIGDGQAAMGGGSIVTPRRVLTAAHVIQQATSVQVGYFAGLVQANRFRRSPDAFYSQPMQSFDVATFANDLAVLQFSTDVFPLANVIPISLTPPTGAAAVASFGFTAPGSLVPSQIPQVSEQSIATCVDALKVTPTHVCATAQGTSVVCSGANGAGLYAGEGDQRVLVGVVSLIQEGCAAVGQQTAYTKLSAPGVREFLISQSIPVADA